MVLEDFPDQQFWVLFGDSQISEILTRIKGGTYEDAKIILECERIRVLDRFLNSRNKIPL